MSNREMNDRIDLPEMLLYLDILAYFPELARNGYKTIGEFIDDYLSAAPDKRPTTMFSGYRSDEETGVVRLIEYLSRNRRIRELKICCDSSDTNMYTALCITEDLKNRSGKRVRMICIILGANYREGLYKSCYGATSTWADNFVGAVLSDTAEQQSILHFFDKAVSKAADGLEHTEYRIIVSGHSKGGNLAQYIAIMRDNVDRCYSFDGQGFSDKFLKKYKARINRNGGKMIGICPDMSIAGSLLHALPNSHRCYIKTGYPKEKNIPLMPLFCHIPTTMLNDTFRLKPYANGFNSISDLLHLVSVTGAKSADLLPFIDAEKGLTEIGEGFRHLFKGRTKQAMSSFLNKDSIMILFIGAVTAALTAPIFILSELKNSRTVQ